MPTTDMKGKHIVVHIFDSPAMGCLPFKRTVRAREYGEFETLTEWTTDDPDDTTVENAVEACYTLGAAQVDLRED